MSTFETVGPPAGHQRRRRGRRRRRLCCICELARAPPPAVRGAGCRGVPAPDATRLRGAHLRTPSLTKSPESFGRSTGFRPKLVPVLGKFWWRVPTETITVLSFRLANRNQTDNICFRKKTFFPKKHIFFRKKTFFPKKKHFFPKQNIFFRKKTFFPEKTTFFSETKHFFPASESD
jgi:hypothetical protein